jgi:hypothetical protein
MKASELRKLIREEAKRVLKEVEGSTIYQYNFTLSRGLFFDGQDEVSEGEMMAFIKEMWKEQGPSGYDMMQIYASKNTETKDPVVAVELEEALVLYSTMQLNEPVAMKTAKEASKGRLIQPSAVISALQS